MAMKLVMMGKWREREIRKRREGEEVIEHKEKKHISGFCLKPSSLHGYILYMGMIVVVVIGCRNYLYNGSLSAYVDTDFFLH